MKLRYTIIFIMACLTVQAQDEEINQLNGISTAISAYHSNFMSDVHTNLGISQQNHWAHSSKVLDKGKYSLELAYSTTFHGYDDVTKFDNSIYDDNAHFTGEIGSWFLRSNDANFDFYLLDKVSGNPIVNPGTGSALKASMPLLSGKGTNAISLPSYAPQIKLGVGYGAEVGFSVLPFAYKSTYNDKNSKLISNDVYWGLSVREDLSYWIKSLRDKNLQLTLGASYNFNHWNLTFDENFDKMGVNDPTVIVYSTVLGTRQTMNNTGFDIYLGKNLSNSFEVYAYGAMVNNRINVRSKGALNIRFPDITAQNPDREIIITDLLDYSKQFTTYSLGAGFQFTFHKFGLGAKYAYQESHFLSVGLSYFLNRKTIRRKKSKTSREQIENEAGFKKGEMYNEISR